MPTEPAARGSRRLVVRLACFVLAALVVPLTGAARAGAESNASSGSTPTTPQLVAQNPGPHGYFEYTAAGGQVEHGSVLVGNPGDTTTTFDVYPADATTSSATGVVYSGSGKPPGVTGRWLHLDASTVTLGASGSQVVHFTVSVPPGIHAGDYVAGIAAENPLAARQAVRNGGSVGVSLAVTTRVVIAVVVHVPGSAGVSYHLGKPYLLAQNGVRQLVQLPIQDTGDLLSKPYLATSLRECASQKVLASFNRQMDTFVPHTSIVYSWSLGNLVLPKGCYMVQATISAGGPDLATVSGKVTVTTKQASVRPAAARGDTPAPDLAAHHGGHTPGWLVALDALVLLLVAAGLVWFLLAAKRRRDGEEDELAAAAHDGPVAAAGHTERDPVGAGARSP